VFVTAYSEHALKGVRGAGGRLPDEARGRRQRLADALERVRSASPKSGRREEAESSRSCWPKSRPMR
jgi:hypothetical protein